MSVESRPNGGRIWFEGKLRNCWNLKKGEKRYGGIRGIGFYEYYFYLEVAIYSTDGFHFPVSLLVVKRSRLSQRSDHTTYYEKPFIPQILPFAQIRCFGL